MQAYRILLFAVMIAAACGGSTSGPDAPPPPPPPAPVASVSVSAASTALVPQQSTQLTATVRDGAGNVLSGRLITWTSSSPFVATVDSTGRVTALAAGPADITAISEGKTGSVSITVAQGGVVGVAGGSLASTDNGVRLTIPAGAVAGDMALTITPTSTPPAPPSGTHAVRGTTYVFGPEGTTFGSPVTVTIKYDPAALPGWVLPTDLVLQRWNGTQWSKLTNLVVDPVAHTVRGRTPGFSTVGVYFLNPQVTITPGSAQVNSIQRSVVLSAEVSGEGRLPDALQFQWTNTGSNGNLSAGSRNTIQYTAVTPILPPGDIDAVGVVVKGQFDPGGPFEVLGEAYTIVKSDLDLAFQVQPTNSLVQYSGVAQIAAQVTDRTGNQAYQDSPNIRYEWSSTGNYGTLFPGPVRTNASSATYTAKPASQQSNARPKIDRVTVKVFKLQNKAVTVGLLNKFDHWEQVVTELGTAEAFVEVIPQYTVTLAPQSATLQAGQSATFQVQISPAWQESQQLFYSWRTTGAQGQLQASGSQSSALYTANQNPSGGTDFVDVDVLYGNFIRLATARASVSVEARTSMVHGSLFITTPVGLDSGRQCVEAYIVFPLVAGARSYEMHAYGFNDTAFWGSEILRTFNVPLPASRQCSLVGWGLTGSDGSQFQFFLTGFAGPTSSIGNAISTFNSRFAHMQVDVTVRY
jgi:uncharacterized protein YjdB